MAEENQVTKEPQQGPRGPPVPTVMKEPQRVTTKNLKKVEAGKRLAAHNHRRREEKKSEQAQAQKGEGVNQYYGIGAVIAIGEIGGLGYYIYQSRRGPMPREVMMPHNPPKPHPQAQAKTNKFEMD